MTGRAAGTVEFGRPTLVVGARRVDLLTVAVTVGLLAVAVVVSVISLGVGEFRIAPWDVVQAAFGRGDRIDVLVVQQWRGPRILMAVVLGALLGMAGAMFQALTGNALGSPDVIGFNSGCYLGALLVIMLTGAHSSALMAMGAVLGGLATAFAVYLLAFKRGVSGFRLIIVGVAVAIMVDAINTWIILRASLQVAISASAWGAGTLANVTAGQFAIVAGCLLVLIGPLVVIGHRMPVMQLGNDLATAMGVRTERTRLLMLVVGVTLTAMATAFTGPISFVALAAPQLAAKLTRSGGLRLLPSAAMGALLLSVADASAQHVLPGQLPVGVVTWGIGGLYLVWLLMRRAR